MLGSEPAMSLSVAWMEAVTMSLGDSRRGSAEYEKLSELTLIQILNSTTD